MRDQPFPPPSSPGASRSLPVWNGIALALAAIASGGSVYLSVGLGLKACPLCIYQRSFAFAVLLVMFVHLLLDGRRSPRACLMSLPMVVSGLGVATFHVYLVQTGKLECPPALFGWGDGPIQSFTLFSAMLVGCLAGTWASGMNVVRKTLGIFAGVFLGLVISGASIASAPPMPAPPQQPYDAVTQPFDMCRPPFHGS